jgi:hypothetical protein
MVAEEKCQASLIGHATDLSTKAADGRANEATFVPAEKKIPGVFSIRVGWHENTSGFNDSPHPWLDFRHLSLLNRIIH